MGRRGRKANKNRKGYFYEREEQAVVDYVTTSDENEKNKIYRECLQPAFTKMIESIIRRYNLYLPDELFQETFDDTLSFLLTKIEHFNPDSGFKAYSYCGTICKNYLILKVKQYNNNLTRNDRFDIVQSEIVDNLKHFTVASKSRFVSLDNQKTEYKNSCSTVETTDTNKTLLSNVNTQQQQIPHKSSYDYPHQIKSNFYQSNWNYFTNSGHKINTMEEVMSAVSDYNESHQNKEITVHIFKVIQKHNGQQEQQNQ